MDISQITHIMSRTLWCPDCNAAGRPKKGNWFIVWGSTHGHIRIKKCHADGITGFVPHLIFWNNKLPLVDGKIHVEAMCGMHGCNIHILNTNAAEGEEVPIEFKEMKVNLLTPEQLMGLIRFKHSGYEIC